MCPHLIARLAFYLFGENLIFRKRLRVATYCCFIFKGKKKEKKILNVIPKGKTDL